MRYVNDTKFLEEVALYANRQKAKPRLNEVFLCNLGNSCMAVGESAYRLFILFGWNLTEFQPVGSDEVVAYIVVTEDGINFLRMRGMKTTVWNTSYEYDNKGEYDIAAVQQFIDRVRDVLKQGEKVVYPIIRKNVTIEKSGYSQKSNITSLIISDNSASVTLDDYFDSFPLVTDKNWNFDNISIALLKALGSVIVTQGDYIIKFAENRNKVIMQQRADNTSTYNVFTESKKHNGKEIILVKEKGFFVSFDDDAIVIAVKTGSLLYNCRMNGRSWPHTAVIVDSSQFMQLTEMDLDIHVANDTPREMYTFGFTGSFLNGKSNAVENSKAAVYKRNNGEFVIEASLHDKELPKKLVDTYIGSYYQSLSDDSIEKKVWLNAIMHDSYDKMFAIASQG